MLNHSLNRDGSIVVRSVSMFLSTISIQAVRFYARVKCLLFFFCFFFSSKTPNAFGYILSRL